MNNALYDTLGNLWNEGSGHPVALLRAEARTKNPWVAQQLRTYFGFRACEVLDVGCGAGFLANSLARQGYQVTGVDISARSLDVATITDRTQRVRYYVAAAENLPWKEPRFDAICLMDLLEHVEDPEKVIREAARVLRPGGLLITHTFNRNPLSWLFAVKGLEWFIKNTPAHLHVFKYFIRPEELVRMLKSNGLSSMQLLGIRPKFGKAFLRLLATREVPEDFEFTLTPSRAVGYLGVSRKDENEKFHYSYLKASMGGRRDALRAG